MTYTNCKFPNGVCNNQYGKTVFDNCTFSNAKSGFYNMWVYGGNVEVKGGSFTGVRGVKVYTEGTTTVAPKVDIAGASFTGISEKAAIVVSKPATVTLDNVSATGCTEGLIQKDIEGSSKVTLNANGMGIGGNFDITANTGSDATKAEFNLNAGTLTSEVSSDFLADGFTLSKSSNGTFGVAEAAPAAVAEVNGKTYPSLQAAINAAPRKATVKLLADTKENVTISTPYVTLDLNGHTLNGGTEKGKPALTVTARVTVMDSSEAQTGTIMREDTAENSGVSSHYVIDVQGDGWLTFESGNVKNDSGAGGTKGASLVRVGDDSVAKYPGLTISGGTFTQDNFIVIKVDRGTFYLKEDGTLNSKNSYAVENWKFAEIKGGTVNGAVAAWTYSGGHNSDLTISGGTINGDVTSVNYGSAEGKVAKVSISGGTVNGALDTRSYDSSTNELTSIDDATTATIAVTGGTFKEDPTKYVVEDSAITKNDDGTYGVAKAYLAKVGGTSYYTMDEAFKAQTTSREAITLLRDYTTGSTFNSGSIARVVDLNGHTWTCTGTDANSAAFEINYPDASLTVKNGKIVSSQLIGLIPSASGGSITYDNSTLTFEGVEASTTATSGIETNGNNTNDTVVLKNSTLNVPNGFGIYFPSSGTLTIDNSTINAKTMGAQVCSGNLNVNAGSTINVSGDPVAKTENDGAIQDGAAISIVNRPGYKGLGQVAITGGTFTAKGDNAAIKAYTWDSSTKQESAFDNSAKTVAVSGGTFSSAVASDLCAEGYAPVANADGTYSVGVPVAQIGGTVFTSLQAAIDAAQAGDTVQLLADAVVDGTVIVQDKGAITLDLNGKTISNTKEIWDDKAGNWSLISVRGNSDLTITGNGAVDALADDSYAIDLYDAASKCTIENGTFTGNISAVYVFDGALTINGGMFDIKQMSGQGDHRFTINCYDSSYKNGTAQVSINSGTFNGFDPANNLAEGTGTTFTAPGYTTVANADGTYGVVAGVALIGTKAYATLAAAVAAAQDGDTVQLLGDVEQNSQLIIGKSITLDLNGKTIKNTVDIWGDNANAILSIKDGAKVAITGNGTMDAKENDCYTINVKKGDLTIENGTFYGNVSVVQVEEGTLSVKGGTFDLHQKWEGSSKYLINCIDSAYVDGSANVVISGGTFVGLDPNVSPEQKVDGKAPSFAAPGVGITKNEDGSFTAAASMTAQILDKDGNSVKAYASLQAAIDAAQDGETVTLLADATEDVAISKSITLDLGGKTLTNTNAGKATISVRGGTVTAKNGNVVGGTGYYNIEVTKGSNANLTLADVTATAGNTGSSMIDNWGTMTITSGSYTGGLNVVKSEEGSTLTINGGTFTRKTAPRWEITGTVLVYGTTTITGGTFNEKSTSRNARVVVTGKVDGYDSVTYIKGGTFNGNGNNVLHHLSPAQADDSFEVSGGTFNKSIPDYYCSDGFIPTTNADGTYGVKEGHYVAQVGSKKYETLADAIRLAAKGKTIQLLTDATENITIAANKQITLDLNGYTLNGGTGTAKATILNEGTVTITDTSAGKTGTIKRDDQGIEGETSYYVIKNIGTMVIDQANVVNNSGYKKANSSGSMVGSSLICNGDDDPQASLTINGGTFNQPNFLVVKNGTNGTLTVNGGTLTSNHSAVQNWNKAQILGGSLTGQIWTDAWVEGAIGETIIGGDAQFTGEIVVDITGKVPPTLKIEGGSLDVTSWRVTSAAAAANATVAVSGGTFMAAVPENYCAAGYAPVANVDGTYGVKLAEGAYLLQDYRSGDQASWTYPTKDGKAFAGWYKDAAFTTPCAASDVEGAAYAKFVKITDLLQYKGGSLRMDVAQPSELTWLRFGYTMALPEGASFVENGWYFKKVSTSQPTDVRRLANNNVLNIDGTITANLVFTGVTTDYYSANFSEKAFVKYVTADGTTVEAVESDYQVNSVLGVADAILAHPMASKAEKDYARLIKAAV